MPKNSKHPLVIHPQPDAENPEWTRERFARAKRFDELPEDVRQALTAVKRGPQKAPTKTLRRQFVKPDRPA